MADSDSGSGSESGPKWERAAEPRAMAAGLAVALLVLVLAVGGMFALGVGPVGDAPDAGGEATPAPSDEGSSDDGSAEPSERAFSLDVRTIEKCGRTCRDTTVVLTNNGAQPREGITVTSTMYAGEDAVWKGTQSVGTLDANASTTRTTRVKVGFAEAAKIKRNGGTVTVETVVRWDGGSTTFTEERQVA